MSPPSISDAALAKAQAEANAKAAAMDPVPGRTGGGGLGGGLGGVLAAIPAVADALGERVRPKRPRVQEGDVAALLRGRHNFDWNKFQRHVADVVKGRTDLGVRPRTIETFVSALRGASSGKGLGRPTYEWLRARTGMCFETIARCYEALEDLSLATICNAIGLGRRGKHVRRANVVLPRFQGEVPEPAPEVVADRLLPLAKQTLAKTWLASLSGLFVRPMGLNTTPLRSDRQAPPAPA
jgi:hypothetical protein